MTAQDAAAHSAGRSQSPLELELTRIFGRCLREGRAKPRPRTVNLADISPELWRKRLAGIKTDDSFYRVWVARDPKIEGLCAFGPPKVLAASIEQWLDGRDYELTQENGANGLEVAIRPKSPRNPSSPTPSPRS